MRPKEWLVTWRLGGSKNEISESMLLTIPEEAFGALAIEHAADAVKGIQSFTCRTKTSTISISLVQENGRTPYRLRRKTPSLRKVTGWRAATLKQAHERLRQLVTEPK